MGNHEILWLCSRIEETLQTYNNTQGSSRWSSSRSIDSHSSNCIVIPDFDTRSNRWHCKTFLKTAASEAEIHCNASMHHFVQGHKELFVISAIDQVISPQRALKMQINAETVTRKSICRNIVPLFQKTTSRDPKKCGIPSLFHETY